jgi:hypothetical protein
LNNKWGFCRTYELIFGEGLRILIKPKYSESYWFLLLFTACQKQLDKVPQGVVFSESLETLENVDAMVTAAYSALGNDHWSTPYTTMWAYGSVRGGDAYKGGGGTGDQSDVHAYELFSLNRVDIGETDGT